MSRAHIILLVAVLASACGPIVPVLDDGDEAGEPTGADDDEGDDARPGTDESDAIPPSNEVGEVGEAGEVDDGNDDDDEAGDTGMPELCGDGVLDPGEICDDGNDDPDDGCELDCTVTPGQMLWSQSIDGAGQDDVARAVAVTTGSEVLVAGSMELEAGDDLWLRVLTSNGDELADHLADLGADELGTAIAITPDGAQYVAGVQPQVDNAVLVRRDGDLLVPIEGAPTDITAFSALASATSEGFVVITHSGGFDQITATVRRYDGSGAVLGDLPQQAGVFVGTAIPSATGGTILGGGSFGGMGTGSTVWLAALAADGSAEWSSSMQAEPDVTLRVRSLSIAADGRIVGVGTREIGGPMEDDGTGWIWWWSAEGQPESDGPLDIGGAAARPNAVVVGTHGLVVGGTVIELEDGFVAGLTTDGALQWGYELAGDLGLEDRVTALALVPGVGVVAVGQITQSGTGEDAWVGMFTE